MKTCPRYQRLKIVAVFKNVHELDQLFDIGCRVGLQASICLMIKSFKRKDLEILFLTGSKEGIQARHAQKLKKKILQMDLLIPKSKLRGSSDGNL